MRITYSLQMKDKYKGYEGCVCTSCKDCENCEIKLDELQGKGRRVVINVDRIPKSKIYGKRCDFVIVMDGIKDIFFLPIEFKKNYLNFEVIKEQLEGSIKYFINAGDLPQQFSCHPILVSRKISLQERKDLSEIQVLYPYGNKRIRHVPCNTKLPWNEMMRKKAASSHKKSSKA